MRTPVQMLALALALVVACAPALETNRAGTTPPSTGAGEGVSSVAPTEPGRAVSDGTPKPTSSRQGLLTIGVEGTARPLPSEIPVRLVVAAMDPAGVVFHDVAFSTRVKDEAGTVVYATSGLREPLGVHRFWVGPLAPGKYSVDAIASPADDAPAQGNFAGPVTNTFAFETSPAGLTKPADLSLSVEGTPRAGTPTRINFSIKSRGDGKSIPNSDNFIQIARDGLLVFRSDALGTSTGGQSLQYSFPEPGKYQVTLTSFPAPSATGVPFAPIAKTISVEVAAEPPGTPKAATDVAVQPTAVASGQPRIAIDVDPPIGPVPAELPARIRVQALDSMLLPIDHVELDIAVKDATGSVVYNATRARAPTGAQEIWVGPLKRGFYTVTARAAPSGDTLKEQADAIKNGLTSERSFEVLPAGLVDTADLRLSVADAPKAGVPTRISFGLTSAKDRRPIVESDNFLTIYHDGLLVYQASDLHSGTALQTVDYTFTQPGSYTLSLTALPTPMRASAPFKGIATTLAVTVRPNDGTAGQATTVPAETTGPGAAPSGNAPTSPTAAPNGPAAVPAKPAAASPTPAPPKPTATPIPQPPQLQEVGVLVKDLEFSPSVIEVPRGSKVALTFSNTSIMPHNLVFPELGVGTPTIDGGQKVKLEFVVDRVGQYDFVCTVLGHREAGMVGKLIVK